MGDTNTNVTDTDCLRDYLTSTGTQSRVRLRVSENYVEAGEAEWARALTGDRTVNGSSPAAVKTFRFGTLAIPFAPPCQCLSDETLKAVGPFYLVSMPGEVKDPTSPHWNV